jgi:hypothetical protein
VTGTAEAKLREAFAKLPYKRRHDPRLRRRTARRRGAVRDAQRARPQAVVCGVGRPVDARLHLDVRRDRTEAQVVQLLLAMRPDLEKVTP